MRTSAPKDIFLSITSKEKIGRASGIILQKEALVIMKAIEAQSHRINFDSGNLFHPSESMFDKLKISPEQALDQLWEIIDYGVATQVYEIKYSETLNDMELTPCVISFPDDIPSVEEAFHRFLQKSFTQIKKYVLEKKSLTEEIWRSILIKISDPEYLKNFGEGDDLSKWVDIAKFPFPPSSAMLSDSRDLILEALEKESKLLIFPKVGFYSILDSQASSFLMIAYEIFLAKIEPFARSFDMGLRDRIEELNQEEAESYSIVSQDEVAPIKKRILLYLAYEGILREKGYFLYVNILNKLCNLAEKANEVAKKSEIDKLLRVYLTMLESTFDFDSRLLRINLEKDDLHDFVIVDQLRKNPNVISAEWHDEDSKISVFALKSIHSLKEINNTIFENYRFTTKYILYFKALIEYNEPDIKDIFKDEDFVKTYGKNLQAVYFNFIPWFYKIFYYLGITPIVNSGYARAKSIIAYGQMDREFKYKKRKENYYKRKLREREEKVERETKFQHKRVLVQAIEEALFTKGTLPTVEWIQANYPLFSPEIIEKIIPDFAFLKSPNRALTEETIISFPLSPEFETRNKKFKEVLNLWIRGEVKIPDHLKSRLPEIRNRLQIKLD